MTRLPILRGVNRMCGGALGFVKGICIVWLFFLVVAICSNTEIGSQLLSMIKESPILTFLYESNVFCGISSNFKIQECLCNPPEAILVGVQSFASHHLTKIKKVDKIL